MAATPSILQFFKRNSATDGADDARPLKRIRSSLWAAMSLAPVEDF